MHCSLAARRLNQQFRASNMRPSRHRAAKPVDPIFPNAEESAVTVEQLATAIRAASAMDIKEKERVCDAIHATHLCCRWSGGVAARRKKGKKEL